jgi:hypothetical protein
MTGAPGNAWNMTSFAPRAGVPVVRSGAPRSHGQMVTDKEDACVRAVVTPRG